MTWPWTALLTDDQFLAQANQLDSEEESDDYDDEYNELNDAIKSCADLFLVRT